MIPQGIIHAMSLGTSLASEKSFGQVQAVTLASTLLIALAAPGPIIEWLVGKPLSRIRLFCASIKQGNYQERLPLPNEARDGEGEDQITVIMRDMNWMARQIEIREKDLRKAVNDLSESRRKISDQNEYLKQINLQLAATRNNLQEKTRELELSFRQMEVMAMTDPLTGMANRRCFFSNLQHQFTSLICSCPPISLLILDIDRFKSVNDTFGHESGDIVLKEIAGLIRESTRAGDLAGRIGGEEYAVLLPDTSSHQAVEIASRIKKRVAEHIFCLPDSKQIALTVSIGICTLSQHACLDRRNIYGFADQALYHAKRSGRNRIAVYDPEAGKVVGSIS